MELIVPSAAAGAEHQGKGKGKGKERAGYTQLHQHLPAAHMQTLHLFGHSPGAPAVSPQGPTASLSFWAHAALSSLIFTSLKRRFQAFLSPSCQLS